MFNPERLSLARKRRKYSKKLLAQAIDVTPITITRLEKGDNDPEKETLEKLSKALNFPVQFFMDDDIEGINCESVSFRSFSRLTARDKDSSLSCGELGLIFSDWVAVRFNLPNSDIPDLSADYTPDSAAMALREYWGLGQRPINDIVKLLESKGVRVFSLREDIKTVDAFSFWRKKTPYIFLNSFKTIERSRFDAAHELGHLVMHVGGRLVHGKEIEREADYFASCFLMPEGDVRSNIIRTPTLHSLVSKKTRWKVSLSALCYRLHKLNILSDWQYRNFCIEINLQFKKTEPNSVGTISSTLWEMVFKELWNKKITKLTISQELSIPLQDLESLVAFRDMEPNKKHTTKTKGLSVVK
jgi:Zn-dependent peptidase ImmA (M78 family)/DNA-binding XRE family transcriptional regulator